MFDLLEKFGQRDLPTKELRKKVTLINKALKATTAASKVSKEFSEETTGRRHTPEPGLRKKVEQWKKTWLEWIDAVEAVSKAFDFEKVAWPEALKGKISSEISSPVMQEYYQLLLAWRNITGKYASSPEGFIPHHAAEGSGTRWMREMVNTITSKGPDFLQRVDFCRYNVAGNYNTVGIRKGLKRLKETVLRIFELGDEIQKVGPMKGSFKHGPFQVFVEFESGGAEQRDRVAALKHILDIVLKRLKAFGFKSDRYYKGKILFTDREGAIQPGAGGEYDPTTDTVRVREWLRGPEVRTSKFAQADIAKTTLHELAHRIWYRMGNVFRREWIALIDHLGKPLSPEIVRGVEELIRGAEIAGASYERFDKNYKVWAKTLSKDDELFMQVLKWYYSRGNRFDAKQFLETVRRKRYSEWLPSRYANVSPIEAFPEIFRDATWEGAGRTGKTHPAMRELVKRILRPIMEEVDEMNWNQLVEGINDPHIFKAVFTAGGPGSGKSFIANQMFKGMGLKFLNSDLAFEYLLDKRSLPFDIDPSKEATYRAQAIARDRAKKLTKMRKWMWLNGMLGLVIDGTGKDYDKITRVADNLKALGYDVSMVFINTTLEVAKERNLARKRSVPEEIVVDSWQSVQNNMGKFQSFFGGKNFVIVDNSETLDSKGVQDLGVRLRKEAMKLLEKPVENRIGKDIMAKLRATGGKTMGDLEKAYLESYSKNESFDSPLLERWINDAMSEEAVFENNLMSDGDKALLDKAAKELEPDLGMKGVFTGETAREVWGNRAVLNRLIDVYGKKKVWKATPMKVQRELQDDPNVKIGAMESVLAWALEGQSVSAYAQESEEDREDPVPSDVQAALDQIEEGKAPEDVVKLLEAHRLRERGRRKALPKGRKPGKPFGGAPGKPSWVRLMDERPSGRRGFIEATLWIRGQEYWYLINEKAWEDIKAIAKENRGDAMRQLNKKAKFYAKVESVENENLLQEWFKRQAKDLGFKKLESMPHGVAYVGQNEVSISAFGHMLTEKAEKTVLQSLSGFDWLEAQAVPNMRAVILDWEETKQVASHFKTRPTNIRALQDAFRSVAKTDTVAVADLPHSQIQVIGPQEKLKSIEYFLAKDLDIRTESIVRLPVRVYDDESDLKRVVRESALHHLVANVERVATVGPCAWLLREKNEVQDRLLLYFPRIGYSRMYEGAFYGYRFEDSAANGAQFVPLEEEETLALDRTLDDTFDDVVRNLVVLGSLDALQDVEFDEDTGSIYLFFSAVIGKDEIEVIKNTLASKFANTRIVASPDKSLPDEVGESDWWVVFIPGTVGGVEGQPDATEWGEEQPRAINMDTSMSKYAAADAVSDIAKGVSVDKAIDDLMKGESLEEQKTVSFEVEGIPFEAVRFTRPIPHWRLKLPTGEILDPGVGGFDGKSVPKLKASLQYAMDRLGKDRIIRDFDLEKFAGRGESLEEAIQGLDHDSFVAGVEEVKGSLKAPFIKSYVSTLGGKERASLMISFSLDPREEWPNRIFQNSRYVQLHLAHTGELGLVAQSYKLRPKFRKLRVKSVADAISKINKWISTKVQESLGEAVALALKKGDFAKVTYRYSSVLPGMVGEVLSVVADKYGNKYANLFFGKNQSGQTLRVQVPFNSLEPHSGPISRVPESLEEALVKTFIVLARDEHGWKLYFDSQSESAANHYFDKAVKEYGKRHVQMRWTRLEDTADIQRRFGDYGITITGYFGGRALPGTFVKGERMDRNEALGEAKNAQAVAQQVFQKYHAKDYFGLKGQPQQQVDAQLAWMIHVGKEMEGGILSDKTKRMLIDRNNKVMREMFHLITGVDIRRANRSVAADAVAAWEKMGESLEEGTTIYTDDAFTKKIAKAAFPDYRGRKFRIEVRDRPIDVASYWSGGSRDYFAFVNLKTGRRREVPSQGPYDPKLRGAEAVPLPPDVVCVKHTIFQGKDLGITIYVRPDNAAKMLPKAVDLTWAEKVVLTATRSLKPSYGGIKNFRFVEARRETGITEPEWDKAKADLIQRKLLNRAGAITNKGRNALEQASEGRRLDLYQLKKERMTGESLHEVECLKCKTLFGEAITASTKQILCPECQSDNTLPTGKRLELSELRGGPKALPRNVRIPKGKFVVVLSAGPNLDYGPHDYEATINIPPEYKVVRSVQDASKAVQSFVRQNDLGAGNWFAGRGNPGYVFDDKKKVAARISYNGNINLPSDSHFESKSLKEALEEVPFNAATFASAFARSLGFDERSIRSNHAKDAVYVEMEKLDREGNPKLRRFSFHQPKWGTGVSVTMLDVDSGHIEAVGNFKKPDLDALVTRLNEAMKLPEMAQNIVVLPDDERKRPKTYTLKQKERRSLQRAIEAALKKTYFRSAGDGIAAAMDALSQEGFEPAQTITGKLPKKPGESRTITVDLAKSTNDPFWPLDVPNAVLSLSFHGMPSGNMEVTGYLS